MLAKFKILIIDEDHKFSTTLIDLLTVKGYEPVAMTSGKMALYQLKEWIPVIVIIDMNLEDIPALDVVHEIKVRSPKTEIIALTGYPSQSSAIELINLGAYGYLQKPCDLNELLVIIHRAMEKWKADEALRMRNRELEELNTRLRKVAQSASEVSACLSVQELAPAIMTNLRESIVSQGGSLYLYYPDHLALLYSIDPGHAPQRIALPPRPNSVFHFVLESKESLLIPDISQDAHLEASGWTGYLNGSFLAFPLLNETGDVVGIISLHNKTRIPFNSQDLEIAKVLASLTSQKIRWVQAMQAHLETEGRFRTVFETAEDCVFIKNINLQFVAINPSMKRLTNQVESDLTELTDEDFFGEPLDYHAQAADIQVLCGETIEDQFTKTVDDKRRIFQVIKVPMRYSTGEIAGICGIARDITVLKQTEESLQYHFELEKTVSSLSRTFVNIPFKDLEKGIQETLETIGKFVGADFCFIFQFNCDKSRLYNTHRWWAEGLDRNIDHTRTLPSQSFPWWMEKLKRSEEIHLPDISILSAEAREEKVFLHSYHISSLIGIPMISRESMIGFIGLASSRQDKQWNREDIALLKTIGDVFAGALERKQSEEEKIQLQEQLNQIQKMEAIGQLAGGVAHDFNNLLTGILGNLSIAKMKPGREIYTYIDNAKLAVERAAKLVKQLLAFSRKSPIKLKPIDLNLLIDEVYHLVRPTINRRIDIHIEKEGSLPSIQADSAQINSVLMNLCVNARDAIEQVMHGHVAPERRNDKFVIAIRTKAVTREQGFDSNHTGSSGKRFVAVCVSDNGAGMNKETQIHLFEPFFSTKGIGKGTGLGLASAYGIVKQHGGAIHFISEWGKGTTFEIYLPVTHELVADKSDAVMENIEGGTETILLVDDEEIIRTISQSILEFYGYTVLVAADGMEALDVYRKERERIDLMILDLSMPNLSGQEVLEHLHTAPHPVKVIVSSGYAEDVDVESLDCLGVTAYLAKPYQPDQLALTVRSVLDMPAKPSTD